VYADALAERGEPRGELIQLQLELERLVPRTEAWGRCAVAGDRLLWEHRATWLKVDVGPTVRRGFIERVQGVRPGVLPRLAGEPIRAVDALEPIPLDEMPPTVNELSGEILPEVIAAVLPRLEHLTIPLESLPLIAPTFRGTLLVQCDRDPDAHELERLRALRRVEISATEDVDVHAVLPELPNLTGLSAWMDRDLPAIGPLDWLDLVVTGPDARALPRAKSVLMSGATAAQLASFDLSAVEQLTIIFVWPDGFEVLAAADRFGALRRLRLNGNGPRRWCDALLPLARQLDKLDVRELRGDNELGDLPFAGLAELHVPYILPSEARRLVTAPPSLGRIRHDMYQLGAGPILDERWPPLLALLQR
jgi:hypothetical protein